MIPARVEARAANGEVTVAMGEWHIALPADPHFDVGDPAYFCIRAADVRLKVDERERPNPFSAHVARIIPEGGTNRVELNHVAQGGAGLTLLMDDYVLGRYGMSPGSPITVWLPSEKAFLCV